MWLDLTEANGSSIFDVRRSVDARLTNALHGGRLVNLHAVVAEDVLRRHVFSGGISGKAACVNAESFDSV